MKASKKIFFCFALLLLLTSCSPKMYVPDMVQIPLAEKQGELKVTGYLSPEHFGGWGFNGQYTITNHLFVTAQHFQEQRYNIDADGTKYKYNFTEAGAGYYSGRSKLR